MTHAVLRLLADPGPPVRTNIMRVWLYRERERDRKRQRARERQRDRERMGKIHIKDKCVYDSELPLRDSMLEKKSCR